MFFYYQLIFFKKKKKIFEKIFYEYILIISVSNSLDLETRSAQHFVEHDLGLNCLDSKHVRPLGMLTYLSNFACFFNSLLIFFKIFFFPEFFMMSVKQLGSRSGPTFCRA